jgi:lipopolysaccharide assembly outer membrane protein LptD (OstA)
MSMGVMAQKNEKVELIRAGALEGVNTDGDKKIKLIGDVAFKQGSMFLYCDSAYQFPKTNKVEAMGNVRMVQGDTLTLTCKKLLYDGNTKQATALGNVLLRDNTMSLESAQLNYSRTNNIAYYTTPSKIKDKDNVLTSTYGQYHTNTKTFQFKKNVHLVNTVKQYTIDADTLEYNTSTKIATFLGPAKLTSKDGDVEAHESGSYDTAKGVMYVKGKSKVKYGKFEIEAQKIDFNEVSEIGLAYGNAQLKSPSDSVVIMADKLLYNKNSGVAKAIGKPVFKGWKNNDTLFITSDTMISVRRLDKDKKTTIEEYIKIYNHVKIVRKGMQGICDSMVYNGLDSMITMYGNPTLWNGKTQLTADTIKLKLKDGQLYKMYMNVKAFIVMEDTVGNFNQVAGRRMEATFKNNALSSVFVDGNSESLFYVLEGDSLVTGINKSICSRIKIGIKDNKVNGVTFLKKPEARFIPPHEVQEPEKRLKGFKWLKALKPERQDIPR